MEVHDRSMRSKTSHLLSDVTICEAIEFDKDEMAALMIETISRDNCILNSSLLMLPCERWKLYACCYWT